jgi:hypothetical protein
MYYSYITLLAIWEHKNTFEMVDITLVSKNDKVEFGGSRSGMETKETSSLVYHFHHISKFNYGRV